MDTSSGVARWGGGGVVVECPCVSTGIYAPECPAWGAEPPPVTDFTAASVAAMKRGSLGEIGVSLARQIDLTKGARRTIQRDAWLSCLPRGDSYRSRGISASRDSVFKLSSVFIIGSLASYSRITRDMHTVSGEDNRYRKRTSITITK